MDEYRRQAENSRDPEELAQLSQKPFPCIRRAAARNPQAPADAVAYVLSQLQKDPIEGVVGHESEFVDQVCDRVNYRDVPIMGIVGYAYVSKSLSISKELLDIHQTDRRSIMERLKELNPKLHQALVNKYADLENT